MKNTNTLNDTLKPEVQEAAHKKIVIKEKLENDGGYYDEADLLAEIWKHLRKQGIDNDEHLLFTGHNTAANSEHPRRETFAITAQEYVEALAYNQGDTPLQYILEEEEKPTISIYDGKILSRKPNAMSTEYIASPGRTIDDALIAEFDVSEWTKA